jgi:peptidoglycan hydrolase CwlO-like protein
MFIGAAVVAVGLFALHASGLSSYPATAFSNIKKTLKKKVPLEFEIERLRTEVARLVPDMRKHLSSIAEEMAAVDSLKDEIVQTRTNLGKQKEKILAMTRALESGTATVSFNHRDYSASRIKEQLARDFESYQRCEAELHSREQLLEAREKSLDAAREQLTTMRTQKQDLEVQVAQLEAQLKTIRAAQSRNKFHFDDSNLARCKATLAELRNRLKVEQINSELEGQFANDTVPVETKEKSARELTKEINGYFNSPKSDDGKVVAGQK